MNLRCMVFALLGLLLASCSGGNGGGATGTPPPKNGTDAPKNATDPARKTAPASVWIDNHTPRACALTLDGQDQSTLEPFASRFLDLAPGKHTFVLTCDGQPAETIETVLAAGKITLVRPASAGAYVLLSRTYTAAGTSSAGGEIDRTPAPKTGVVAADYGPLTAFPAALPGSEAATVTRTRIVRGLPENPDWVELEHFILADFRIYGFADAPSHLEAIFRLLPSHQERFSDEKLLGWLGIDSSSGKVQVPPDGTQPRPSAAAVAAALLLQREKTQVLLEAFPTLTAAAARAVVAILANPPAPDELRRRIVTLGFGRSETEVLVEAAAALADKSFIPDEAMVEALTATIERLNLDEGDKPALVKQCASALVDAFYRHPAVVAREKTRRFLVRFAHPGLEPTLENARYALIEGRCASDLVPLFIHYTFDERTELIGRLVAIARKREAVGQDILDLVRAALADEDTRVRIVAAQAIPPLAAYLTPDNLAAFQDLLVRALHDPSLEVHREAARILEIEGFVPTEQIADELVAAWRQLDGTDPQGVAERDYLAKLLKTSFEKNPGSEADKEWRERALAALAP